MIIGNNNQYTVSTQNMNNYGSKQIDQTRKNNDTESVKGKSGHHGHHRHHIKKDDGSVTKTNGTDTLTLSKDAIDALNKSQNTQPSTNVSSTDDQKTEQTSTTSE